MPRGNGKKANPQSGMRGLGKYVTTADGYGNEAKAGESTDWSSIHPDILAAAVVSADRSGGALLFGADRRKTQFAITVFADGGKNTFYWPRTYAGAEDLQGWLSRLITDLNSELDEM